MRWFTVRSVCRHYAEEIYEERITLWFRETADDAIHSAEVEALEYAEAVDGQDTGIFQYYDIGEEPGEAVEIFSLMRSSADNPAQYLTRYFDTGTERQRSIPDD